jgi:DNA-binding Xre family transcriptional regulator
MNSYSVTDVGPVAPNNLDKMIRRSGLKNNMVAELKGIQPATLSRHKSGDIGISLGDAEEYAKILNCSPQQIFFSAPPIPVLACVFPWDDECGEKAKKIAPHLINSNNGKNPTLVMGHSAGHMERMLPYQDKAIYMHDYYLHDTMCVFWNMTDDLDHSSGWMNGNLDIVNIDPMQRGVVDKECLGHYSIVKTRDQHLLYGVVYQTGRNRYSLESNNFGTHTNLELEWGCPIVTMIIRPELREMQWVDYDVTNYREQLLGSNK